MLRMIRAPSRASIVSGGPGTQMSSQIVRPSRTPSTSMWPPPRGPEAK